MQDKWRKWMRRSDCILGVTPDQGGSWLSPLREEGPLPSVTPAAEGGSWAVGAGMLRPVGMEMLFEFPAGSTGKCGTALDLQGSLDSFTVCIDFEIGSEPLTMNHRWWPILLAQGFPHTGQGISYSMGVWLRKDSLESSWNCYCAFSTEAGQILCGKNIDLLAGRHSVIVIRDVAQMSVRMYFDRQLIAERENKNISEPLTSGIDAVCNPDLGVCIGGGLQSENLSYEGWIQVNSAMIFDRVFSEEEITALF